MRADRRSTVLGVSLKMYLDHERTMAWSRQVAEVAGAHPAVTGGDVEMFVMPSFPSLPAVVGALRGTPVAAGAQDLFWEDTGAFTGAVSGSTLEQVGCRYVEVGHAERRRMFGDTDDAVALKIAAAVRNRLTPVLCVGEHFPGRPDDAVDVCRRQLASALVNGVPPALVVAFEPHWAIGAAQPASTEHVRIVCEGIRDWLDEQGLVAAPVIYGGSAGPGLLTRLGPSVDGLFLGRHAHDVQNLGRVLDEIHATRVRAV
jgi:triosephosphate isomerase